MKGELKSAVRGRHSRWGTVWNLLVAAAIALSLLPLAPAPAAYAGSVAFQYVTGLDFPDTRGGMILDDLYVYISGHQNGLWRADRCTGANAHDINAPDAGSWDLWWYNSTGNYPKHPELGYYIFEAGKTGSVYVFKTGAGDPTLVKTVATGAGEVIGVYATSPTLHKLYAATVSGIRIYDIANPENPVLITTLNIGQRFLNVRGYYDNASLEYGYVFATSQDNNTVYAIDINTNAIVGTTSFAPYGMSGTIRRQWVYRDDGGNYFDYIVNDSGDLWILNVNNPAAPVLVSSWNSPAGGVTNMPGGAVYVKDDYAYVMTASGNSNGHLYLLDVHNPANPIMLDHLYDPEFGFNDIRIDGCEVHIAAHDGWKMYTVVGWQPDSLISNTDTSNYVGQDIYEKVPSVQVKSQTVSPNQTATFKIHVENDANRIDQFLVRGGGGDTGWTVAYFDSTGDVTAQVVAGTYKSADVVSGGAFDLTLTVKPAFGVACPTTYSVNVVPESASCPVLDHPTPGCSGSYDAVRALVTVGCPEMTVAKTDGKTQVGPGDTLPYVITYSNTGDAPAKNIVVTDVLPSGTTYVSASPTPASVTHNAPAPGQTTIVWNIPGPIAGNSGPYKIFLDATVNTDVPAPSSLLNTVTLGYQDVNDNPYPPVEDTDLDNVPEQPIRKQVSKDVAGVGDMLIYTVTLSYNGIWPLVDAVVTDTIPVGTSYISGTVTAGGTYSPTINTIEWAIGSNEPAIDGVSIPDVALCPTVKIFYPTGDTYISKKDPSNNYGTAATMLTRPADANSLKYSLLRFDVTGAGGVPAGSILRSAKLYTKVQTAKATNHVDAIYSLKTAWTEGTNAVTGATWNDPNGTGTPGTWVAGAFSASDYWATKWGSQVPSPQNAWKAVDVTGAVDQWVNQSGTYTNNGFVLISTGTDKGDAKYYTRETAGTVSDPYLWVVYMVETPGGCNGPTTIYADADTFVDRSNVDTNSGAVTTFTTRALDDNHRKYGLVHFDLVQIPTDAIISAATYQCTVTTAKTNQVDNLYRMLTPWTELAATWNDPNGADSGDWATTGGAFGSSDYNVVGSPPTITPGTTGIKTATVTALVQEWVNQGKANNGLVHLATGTNAADVKYASREDPDLADKPQITVNWTLPPSLGATTRVKLSAAPQMLSHSGNITVTMQLTATSTVNGVVPPADLTYSAPGVTVSKVSGPQPAGPFSIGTSPTLVTYVYHVVHAYVPRSVRFSGKPSAPSQDFGTAISNSTLLVPPLVFRVTITANPPNPIVNQAFFADGNVYVGGTPSNEVYTRTGGSIGDYVWYDENHDGIQDPAESGLAGVTVELRDNAGTLITTTVTDADGFYTFDNLAAATYKVNIVVPAGLQLTTPPTVTHTLLQGEDYVDADFGLDDAGKIIGTVWHDLDGDGTMDPGEAGIPGATVILYDSDGNVVATTTSGPNGEYQFLGLPPGDYSVYVDPLTVPEAYRENTTPDPLPVTLPPGGTGVANFGFVGRGSIGDLVWKDTNGDGIYQPLGADGILGTGDDEPGLGNVQVVLTTPSGTLYATTAEDGSYLFAGLPPGSYTVNINPATVPSGYGLTTGNLPLIVNLAEGQDYLDADFGYRGTGSIGDTVWADMNASGTQDSGEAGIPGVDVWLFRDTNANGQVDASDVLLQTTSTDPNGIYRFDNLPPGDYVVFVNTSDPDMPPAYSNTTPNPLGVSLGAGETYNDADFGFGPYAAISGTVFRDRECDGLPQDPGDPGLGGVTIELRDSGGQVVATTVTDSNGDYLFLGVVPGNYVIHLVPETLPAGMVLSTANDLPVGATAGGYYPNNDFAVCGTGTIGDLVWEDLNGDGVWQTHEPGLPGVVVYLYEDVNHNGRNDDGEPLVGTATTDAAGIYHFNYLPAGDYVVAVPTRPAGYAPTTIQPIAVSLDPDEIFLDADFGFKQGVGSIGDTVFYDANGNAWQDTGTTLEYGVPGVTVMLFDGVGNYLGSEVTDADGHYLFANLPPGDYSVQVDTATIPVGTGLTTPSPVIVTGLAAGQFYGRADFGLRGTSSIGDFVWHDANGDGLQAGESGIPNLIVELWQDTNGDGVLDREWGTDMPMGYTVTDANGLYGFGSLADGTYFVWVPPIQPNMPAGFTPTTADPVMRTISAPDTHITDADVGFGAFGGIGDYVWDDANRDGIQGPMETGLAGLTVALYTDGGDGLCGNGNDVYVDSTVTDASGMYVFTPLPAATYCVDVQDASVPAGFVPTLAFQGVPDADSNAVGNAAALAIVSPGSGLNSTIDFGFYRLRPAIALRKIRTSPESGVAAVGDTVTFDVVVTNTGETNLTSVAVVDTYDMQCMLMMSASLPPASPAGPPFGSPVQWNISLAKGASTTLTLGFRAMWAAEVCMNYAQATATDEYGSPVGPVYGAAQVKILQPGTIGDRVWLDENGDGVQDAGEAGIPNVLVTLTGIDALGNPVSLTTYTDTDGGYIFSGVLPGSYTVTVTPPAGQHPTYDEDGIATPSTSTLVLANGEEHVTADFGYNWSTPCETGTPGDQDCPLPTGAIGDRVWIDADGDGKQDPGEAGLPDVTVGLYVDNNGDGVYETLVGTPKTTDAAGYYIFDDLPAGSYVVKVTPPAGYGQTGDPDQPGVPCTACDDQTTTPVILAPGDVYVNADFGYEPEPGTGSAIGDLVYTDLNGNGVWDTGEPGIPGVTVALLDGNGNIIATTTTNPAGNYLFAGLPAGTYTVWVNDTGHVLGELTQTGDPDAALDHRHTLTVDGTSDYLDNDFGYAPPGQVPGDGVIGDTVFLDRNGNGLFDAGEGMEGVVVELYDAAGTTLLGQTTTNENGTYYFGGLNPAGSYMVKVESTTLTAGGVGLTNTVDPEGDGDGQSLRNLAVTGPIDLSADFGYALAANPNTISGTIWTDRDADGIQDAGELGRYAGVTVVLYDLLGNIVGTTTTDANGNYSFTGLPAGTYVVDVTDDAGVLAGTWHTLGDQNQATDGTSKADPYTVSVTGGQTVNTVDFGYRRLSAGLGNWVWVDESHDSMQQAGEPGIPGVPVTLRITYATGAVVTLVTTTDAAGYYGFGNLLLDETFSGPSPVLPIFDLSLPVPDGTTPCLPNVGPDDIDSDGLPGPGNTVTVAVGTPNSPLVQGRTNTEYDFGFWPLGRAAIGDRIWLDEDGNGVQDAGEPGIANVVVQLYDATGTTLIASTLTDSSGGYLFTGLMPNTYVVKVDTTSMEPGLAENPTGDPDGLFDNQTSATVVAGQEFLTADFGYNWSSPCETDTPGTGDCPQPTGAIGDRLWIDSNGDGVQDPDEAGLPGIPVALWYDANSDGIVETLYGSTTTGAAGDYIFDNLPPGSYQVIVNGGTTPPGYTQTGDPDGTMDNRTTSAIPLAPGDVFVDADFGYRPQQGTGSSIGDLVYTDLDGNGQWDPGEPGIPGVSVVLLDGAGNVIATMLTDPDGEYLFTGVPAGTYTVWVNDTGNVLGELSQTGDPDATLDNQHTLTVDGTSSYLDNDFGYAPSRHDPGDGLIGDTIFLDANGNGVYDTGDSGLEGVTVQLYDESGTTLLRITATDENGNYYFGDLGPLETYMVKVDTATLPGALSNSSDPDGVKDSQAVRDLEETGPVDLDADFGYKANIPNTICGTIWNDANANGLLDLDEIPIPGVTVVLYDADGDVVGYATTDGSGDYCFAGLPDGTYYVDVTDDENVVNGWWHSEGPTPGADGNSQADPYPVTVAGGETDPTGDFGYYTIPAALGDYVWHDAGGPGGTGDGIQAPGEPGIAGAKVVLYITYPNGTLVKLQDVTDANGYYRFDNLLLDEDFGHGTGDPVYVIKVDMSSLPSVYLPSPLNQAAEGLDSDDPLGEPVTPPEGLARGYFQPNYDFGFYEKPTNVQLLSFTAVWEGEIVRVEWQSAAELRNIGYNLYRSETYGGPRTQLNAELIASLVPPGSGQGALYTWMDASAVPGQIYLYWLESVDIDGLTEIFGPAHTGGFRIFLPAIVFKH